MADNNPLQRVCRLLVLALLALIGQGAATGGLAQGAENDELAARRGYHLLITKSYLPPDFSQEVFDEVWQAWEEPLRSGAARATADERQQMAFARYGFTPRPDNARLPLQYVVDERGNWSMSCLACHQGTVAGKLVPGAANTQFALQTLTEDIRLTKLRLGKPLTRMDVGSMFMPLGGTVGTTNSVMFGVVLMAFRDADLNVLPNQPLPRMVHHDLDAPAWWHFARKQHLYIDGFATKSHRALMQFTLVKENGPEVFRQREADFQDIYAYLQSLRPPRYPYPIDEPLAAEGRAIFDQHCATCHGTYGEGGKYPEKRVPINIVGTDRVRLDALLPEQRAGYGASWFTHYGRDAVVEDPQGYVAPPLDGLWASAPYFHNGSVPTVWHVLHPQSRPVVWTRDGDEYDADRLGPKITEFEAVPADIIAPAQRRRYFDTRHSGKSAAGHDFADVLEEPEKQAVLEYLKTL